jgi:hypothetical protein
MSNRAPTRPRVANLVQLFNSKTKQNSVKPTKKVQTNKNRSRSIVRTVEGLDTPKAPITSSRSRSNGVYRPRTNSGSSSEEISRPLPVNRGIATKPRTALEQVLRMPVLRDGLLEFAKKEFSDESVLLLLAIHEYKISTGVENRKKKAWDMYNKYITRNAEKEVNLDAFMCEELLRRLQGLDKKCYVKYTGVDIFEEIEVVVGASVADIFFRYTSSPAFNK